MLGRGGGHVHRAGGLLVALAAFVAGLALLGQHGIPGTSQYARQGEQQASRNAQPTGAPISQGGIQPGPCDAVSGNTEENPNCRGYQRAEQDLSAQQEMATFAGRLVWLTFAQLVATLGGMWLLWKSIELNRGATRAATRAVAVSRLARSDAQRHGEMGLRAYVGAVGGRLYGTGLRRIEFQFKNFGQTPAYDVQIEYGIKSAPTMVEVEADRTRDLAPINPGQQIEYPMFINDEHWETAADPNAAHILWVVGSISYTTFGSRKVTLFRHVLDTTGGTDGAGTRSVKSGNDAS